MLTKLRFSLIALLLVSTAAAVAQAQTIAIRAGRLIDPDSGAASGNQVILVEGGVIKAVGGSVTIPPNARVIDLRNATVLPGLFDMHTHLCMAVKAPRDAGKYYYTTLNDPDSARAIEGVVNARTMLESGFTTVRDIGNEGNFACTSVRRAIENKIIPGPTMFNAGRIIAPYGGQFQLQPDKPGLAEPEYFFADTRDEMVKAIRENVHYGANVIRIVIDDQRYIYSTDDIRFMIDEAARAGLKLAAHAWTRQGAHNAAMAGVASIEHGFDMTDEDLAIAKKNNVVLVGTEYLGLKDATARPQWVDRLRRAYKIGVTMAYGTDVVEEVAGQMRGTLSMSGIDPWIEAGIPGRDRPVRLLRVATPRQRPAVRCRPGPRC
jgi:imidazolonepropionase-like amidohydrolase